MCIPHVDPFMSMQTVKHVYKVYYLAKIGLCNLLHLKKNHGGDLLWVESFSFSFVIYFYFRPCIIINNGEWPVLHV